jgi:uncharacterized SAM-binding protein YcdF (DUF218 family)
MFTISKVLWWFVEPTNLVFLALAAGAVLLWTRWTRFGRRVVACVTAVLLAVAILPLETLLIEPLENRFPTVRTIPDSVTGAIVLGGSVNQLITVARDQAALTGAAERMTEFVAIARRRPDLKLVFTGGSGRINHQDVKETIVARRLFSELGLDIGRIVFEDQSRNTRENAANSYALVAPGPGERWLLITSAMHMPRSVGCFRRVGWSVVPYPVDYQTKGDGHLGTGFSLGSGLTTLSIAAREWLGLAAYWFMGWTDAFVPGPERG